MRYKAATEKDRLEAQRLQVVKNYDDAITALDGPIALLEGIQIGLQFGFNGNTKATVESSLHRLRSIRNALEYAYTAAQRRS